MRVILIGGGRTGFNLAKRLLSTGNEPIIIEEDEDRANELSKKLDTLIISGSGTELNILKKAEVKKADALAALTPNDETNLMVAKLAKELGSPQIIARVNETKHIEMFEDIGADATISSIMPTVGLLEKAITGSELYGLLSLGGDKAEVIEVTVSKESKVVGKPIEELDLPDLCTIAMITRDNELINPKENPKLEEEDRVMLAGDEEDIKYMGALLRGKQ